MNKHISPKLSRRAFVIGTAAAGAGLSIGLDIPFGGPTWSAPPMDRPRSTPGW